MIASIEEARRKAAERPNAPAVLSSSTLKTSDFGKLDWPVDGTIIYRFGRVVNPNNTTIRWNGVGIAAPSGTPVKAVAAGEVMVAEPIGTYGLTVIVQHGGGDYSVYGSLSRADVQKGQQVIKGQVIGTVGVSDPELRPSPALRDSPAGTRDGSTRLAARGAEVTVHRCSTCGRFRDYARGTGSASCAERVARGAAARAAATSTTRSNEDGDLHCPRCGTRLTRTVDASSKA